MHCREQAAKLSSLYRKLGTEIKDVQTELGNMEAATKGSNMSSYEAVRDSQVESIQLGTKKLHDLAYNTDFEHGLNTISTIAGRSESHLERRLELDLNEDRSEKVNLASISRQWVDALNEVASYLHGLSDTQSILLPQDYQAVNDAVKLTVIQYVPYF